MGYWTITIPEAGTNLVLNQGFEFDAIASAAATSWAKEVGTETFLVDSAFAHNGLRSLKITTAATTDSGASQDVTANTSASTQYTASAWVRGSGTVRIYLFDSVGGTQASANFTLTTNWQRISVTATYGTGASRFVRITNTSASAITFWVDDVQLEQKAYMTSYIDGDQPGCWWVGTAWQSQASRDAQFRLGGREVDLETTYGVKVLTNQGAGMAPLHNNLQPMALQPGSIYQSVKIEARELVLLTSTQTGIGVSVQTVHQRRRDLINLLKPDAVRGTQPLVIGYTGANSTREVYGAFRYDGGLEFGQMQGRNEQIAIRLMAANPLWFENTQEIATLNFTASLASDRAFGRVRGTWQRFGSGFNDLVQCLAIDYQHNRIYFGGKFTTANGVTVNGIAYWDGATFQPLGAATKGIGVAGTNIVYSIAVAPNGDVWAGGDFTTAGGAATKGLAKWAYPGTGAPTIYNTATTFTDIRAIAIDKNYKTYIGGTFTVFMGIANASYIASTIDQGTTWAAVTATPPSGGTPKVYAMALDVDGVSIYFGGDFTAVGGVANTARIAKWNGVVISALATGAGDNAVRAMVVTPDGSLYMGGTFTAVPAPYFAKWNGVAWTGISMPSGIASVYALAYDPTTNLMYMAANSSVLYLYNFSLMTAFDIILSGVTPTDTGLLVNRNTGDIYWCTGSIGSAPTLEAGMTSVTPGSTFQTYPLIVITGTTTAGATSTLNFIENQSSNQRLYFNLVILAGETITINLQTGRKIVSSDWRGVIYNQPLSNSDLANWRLLPGANTIACYMSGTTTGCNALMRWSPLHWALDGVS